MSIKSRIEALENALAKTDPPETVIVVHEVVVRTHAEVEQLRAAGLLDEPKRVRPVARGPVRIEVRRMAVDEILKKRS